MVHVSDVVIDYFTCGVDRPHPYMITSSAHTVGQCPHVSASDMHVHFLGLVLWAKGSVASATCTGQLSRLLEAHRFPCVEVVRCYNRLSQ